MDSEKFLRRLRRGTIRYLALACVVPVAAATTWAQGDGGAAPSGADALDRFLESVDSLSAAFTQEIWTADQELLEEAVGTMSLKRPNRFYWHYATPVETIVVADGKALWMYDVELAQVSVTSLADIAAANPAMLLSGDESLRDGFDVTQTYRLDGLDWVKLAPRESGGDFSSVLIGFSDGLPRQLELVDGLDHTTRIEFREPRVNADLDERLFEFEPPAGVDVIGSAE